MDAAVREAVAAAPKASAEEGWVAVARRVASGSGFEVIDGAIFDQFSAGVMVQVHDALSAANQAKFAAMGVSEAQRFAFKIIVKVRKS